MKWTSVEIKDLTLAELFTEVDAEGNIKREIGLDINGNVKHVAPSKTNMYGLFDNQPIDKKSIKNEIHKEKFDALWESAT